MSGGSLSATMDDDHHQHDMALDVNIIISAQDRKEQALKVLKSDILEKLNKEVKSLDEDSWMFEGPRSRIHLVSGPGGRRHRHTEISMHYMSFLTMYRDQKLEIDLHEINT